MTIFPLQLPPGFHQHGTDLEGQGRWRDGSLVRWRDGSLRPVGGWVDRLGSAPYNAAPRGMVAWEDETNTRRYAVGTYNKLYVTTSSGTTTDITPATLTAGDLSAELKLGYGGGFYGTSFYGQARPDTGQYGEATTWSIDTWGQYLVACSVADGTLWEWQLDTLNDAAAIANAPTNCLGLVVTENRFLFALGADGNPRKVAWCDFEDNTTWTPSSSNQAGYVILQTPGQIMAGIRTSGQTLIVTDQDAHRAVYAGPPYVHRFERVGSACGLAARKAIADTPAGVFWMGARGFFHFDGSNVSSLPCEIHDKIFSDINTVQISKIWAVSNGEYGEVWFFYPSSDSEEVNRYAAFDYKQGHWMMGALARTTGVDSGAFDKPIWCGADGSVYDHEVGFNYDGSEVYAETGPIMIGSGEHLAVVTELIPDERNLGDVTATFKTRLYPTGAETTHGPYSMSNPTSVRFQGRQVRMRVTGTSLESWRVGRFAFDVKQGGRR